MTMPRTTTIYNYIVENTNGDDDDDNYNDNSINNEKDNNNNSTTTTTTTPIITTTTTTFPMLVRLCSRKTRGKDPMTLPVMGQSPVKLSKFSLEGGGAFDRWGVVL